MNNSSGSPDLWREKASASALVFDIMASLWSSRWPCRGFFFGGGDAGAFRNYTHDLTIFPFLHFFIFQRCFLFHRKCQAIYPCYIIYFPCTMFSPYHTSLFKQIWCLSQYSYISHYFIVCVMVLFGLEYWDLCSSSRGKIEVCFLEETNCRTASSAQIRFSWWEIFWLRHIVIYISSY